MFPPLAQQKPRYGGNLALLFLKVVYMLNNVKAMKGVI